MMYKCYAIIWNSNTRVYSDWKKFGNQNSSDNLFLDESWNLISVIIWNGDIKNEFH